MPNGRRQELGRTETIQDNLNPVFEKKFMIDYFFETRQVTLADVHGYRLPWQGLATPVIPVP